MSATLDGSGSRSAAGTRNRARDGTRACGRDALDRAGATPARPGRALERRVADAAAARSRTRRRAGVPARRAEIRRAAEHLAAGLPADVDVVPLYGELGAAAQDAALRPAPPERRKMILATNIAETSLTIEGVRVVVDSGFERRPRFDPNTGMSRLETVRISRASADQRRGRAGRTAPGVCYRLWTESTARSLPPQTPPEILEADLAPLALELAEWGCANPQICAGSTRRPAPLRAGARPAAVARGDRRARSDHRRTAQHVAHSACTRDSRT